MQDDPEDADGGLFVAYLDVPPDEEVEELAVGPGFAEAKLEETTGRLDAKSDGGAGVEPKSSGFWRCSERSHARFDKTLEKVKEPPPKGNREEEGRSKPGNERIREGTSSF